MSVIIALLLAAAAPSPLPTGQALTDAVTARDAEFFALFFTGCDPDRLATMLTSDFEFYHDRDGVVTRTAKPFVEQYGQRCADRQKPDGWRSRREAVAGTIKVYPIAGYGAVEQGEHVFYERQGDGPEHLAGRAAFTQLWAYVDGRWQLARVLSYDHSAAR